MAKDEKIKDEIGSQEDREMKSCGTQSEDKLESKTETMVKDTSYSYGEMKEVGSGMKDAATGQDENEDFKSSEIAPIVKSGKEDPGIPYDWAERLLKGYNPGDIEASAKMAILFCILEESMSLGDRILVFSQSLFTLNLIEDFLQKTDLPGRSERWARNWNYYRLDGSTSALEREKLINEFNSNPNIHLFLVSTRAGSLGINLVGANRVIVFDASWNPCHDTQAVCRVYRYGQKKPCFVYRLVMDNCLEKKIYDRQINKQGMADRVVDECNPDAHLSIKEVTNLCWDSEEVDAKPTINMANIKDKYIDVVMQKVLDRYGNVLSKEPFQHESLLVDRKDKKLSQAEKRLAKRSYELEKQANINSSRPVYGYNPGGNQQGLQIRPTFRAIRGEGAGGVINKPMASVRPMQSELSSQLVRDSGRPRSWIPAEVWQKQGMSAQEMTLPLDVVIPTNSPDRSSIVLKAGQKVMVLKSPKGIYMQLENGKIIAIRTAIKVGNKGGEKKVDKRDFSFESKKVAVQPNRQRVPNMPMMRNNNISIIPRGGGNTGITSRGGGVTGNKPLVRMLGNNNNRPWGAQKQPIATTKPYFGETPPVTVTVTKKKADASATTLSRIGNRDGSHESKDNSRESSTDNLGDMLSMEEEFGSGDVKQHRPRNVGITSTESGRGQEPGMSSSSYVDDQDMMNEHDRLRSEEDLLHDMDDEDFDDDDDDEEEEHLHHHMHQHHPQQHHSPSPHHSHHHRSSTSSHQHHSMNAPSEHHPSSTSKKIASTSVGAGDGMHHQSSSSTSASSSAHVPMSAPSMTSTSSLHTSSVGHGSNQSLSSATPSAALGAAPLQERNVGDGRHHQHHHHHPHQQMMSSHHHQQQQPPVSNVMPVRPDENDYAPRYPKSSTESLRSSVPINPSLPMQLSSSITVSPVASTPAVTTMPMTSPGMTSSTARSSTSTSSSLNPTNAPLSIPPAPSVTIDPIPINPSPYHHGTLPPPVSGTSTGRRYTGMEYTADTLAKSTTSDVPSSFPPALSHLKTISDHSISIFPVDSSSKSSSSSTAPSSTITSGSPYSGDYNYRQDFQTRHGASSGRDYYPYNQPNIGGYSSGYYPSSTATSSTSSSAQRKEAKDATIGSTYPPMGGSYESSSYLAPNPFTAAAVGSGYPARTPFPPSTVTTASSTFPQSTPPPTTQSSGGYGSSSASSDFSRMYSAFHRPEPSSFQPVPPPPQAPAVPPAPPAVPPAVPPTHQPYSPYNYNPFLMQPHPAYPPHHIPPPAPPGNQQNPPPSQ